MDTSVLRVFASVARVGLLGSVGARVGVVLAAGSDERAVSAGLVAELEREIGAAGGGDAGRGAVTDRVAYTWFNRIVALRFMDAAGVTSMGVVSPAPGGVQPEVLTAAKQGVFEDAVPPRDRVRVTGFLTGELASSNKDRDAYAVLLSAYCRHWNRAMPFLFEKTADYTELLIPEDLLADDSVRDKAVKALTPEVCEDVEVIGWLYQFYIADRKDEVFAGFKKGKKAGAAEIPAATQLFTPHWIVRYLVENSLGRLWLLNHPDSALRQQMEYYIDPVDEETDYLKISSPEEIKVIDPACGSGHMLTYAFDLLYAIYEEQGYPPSDIPTLILLNNLFGTEIDERAGTLAAFALTMKARLRQKTFLTRKITPHIRVLRNVVFTPDELTQLRHPTHHRTDEDAFWNLFTHADLFGSLVVPNESVLVTAQAVVDGLPEDDLLSDNLKARAQTVADQATYLSQRYHIVIANPPYMGSRNMGDELRSFADHHFPSSAADLYSMFMSRWMESRPPDGHVAMVTMQTWMFLTSHAALRQSIIAKCTIQTMAHLGTKAFDSIGGDVVSATAFVLRRQKRGTQGTYVRLTDLPATQKEAALRAAASGRVGERVFSIPPEEFELIPGAPIAYDFSPQVRSAYRVHNSIGDTVPLKQGMATTDNARFVRFWFEVSGSGIARDCADWGQAAQEHVRWVPYNKGGSPRRWYGNQDHIVKWSNEAQELSSVRPSSVLRNKYFFRPSVSWSNIGTYGAMFRVYPSGYVFDVAGMSAFPPDDESRLALLGYLNSPLAGRLLDTLAPTVNFQIGDIGKLPYVASHDAEMLRVVRELIGHGEAAWRLDETAWGFDGPPFDDPGHRRVNELESTVTGAITARLARQRELQVENAVFWDRLLGVDEHETESLDGAGEAYGESVIEAPAWLGTGFNPDLVSYAVGNMVGRYALDQPGLVLADQGDSFETFLERVPGARFLPDRDNVIPIVDGDWFEDDIVARFREWLKVAFGVEHLQENWQYIEDTLGKSIRQYFVRDFYNDHVKRYKKRPIYWMFSSPKGFNALIYLHRYTPSTAGTVLHDYVLPFLTKLETELGKQEHLAASADTPRAAAAASKQAETLRRQILEVREWATDVLHPLADQRLVIDLDDGVKHNYPRPGQALKRIPGLDTPND